MGFGKRTQGRGIGRTARHRQHAMHVFTREQLGDEGEADAAAGTSHQGMQGRFEAVDEGHAAGSVRNAARSVGGGA
jgi:hypothetical protein